MANTKATEITYTPNELNAIEILKANRGTPLSAKELGIANVILTSLANKANDSRPMAEGVERIMLNKKDYDAVCSECGRPIHHKLYWID